MNCHKIAHHSHCKHVGLDLKLANRQVQLQATNVKWIDLSTEKLLHHVFLENCYFSGLLFFFLALSAIILVCFKFLSLCSVVF